VQRQLAGSGVRDPRDDRGISDPGRPHRELSRHDHDRAMRLRRDPAADRSDEAHQVAPETSRAQDHQVGQGAEVDQRVRRIAMAQQRFHRDIRVGNAGGPR